MAISLHLTVLKNAGLLTERRESTHRLYRAPPRGLKVLRRFLDDMWASFLKVARQLVEAERGPSEDHGGFGSQMRTPVIPPPESSVTAGVAGIRASKRVFTPARP